MTEEDFYNELQNAVLLTKYQDYVDDVANPITLRNNITGQALPLASIVGAQAYQMKKNGISFMYTLSDDAKALIGTKTLKFFSVAERFGYAVAAALPASQQDEPA